MASKPIVPQQVIDDLNKNPPEQQKKKPMAENKNRRALGDIGNLAADVVSEIAGKKITRPVTRSFRAQLLANAQTAADKKQICVKVTRAPAVVKNAPPKKPAAAVVKPKLKPAVNQGEVINIESDTEEETTKANSEKTKIREESKKKKKKVQTFTSILATGSKLACGSAKNKPNQPEPVFDIDASDVGNHLAVTEYVDDIYAFYKEAENECRPIFYMESQQEITTKMRSILVDWLIDVHQKFELAHETLYLTINIVDRFLSTKPVPRRELQLVGIAATLTASKYEEIWPPEVNDLVLISDRAYTNTQILTMEKTILAHLEWTLTVPTRFVFLTRFVKAASDRESLGHMAAFFSELGLMDYECSVGFKPSVVAAAAVYAARWVMKRVPVWSPVLEFYSGYREEEVMVCGKILIGLKEKVGEGNLNLKTVVRKYSSPLKGSVALIPSPPLKN